MVTVEDLLMAYASAYDAWLDPEAERKNPTPEYAELIRQAVSFENEKLRELAKYAILCSEGDARCLDCPYHDKTAEPHIICMMRKAAHELGVEVTE